MKSLHCNDPLVKLRLSLYHVVRKICRSPNSRLVFRSYFKKVPCDCDGMPIYDCELATAARLAQTEESGWNAMVAGLLSFVRDIILDEHYARKGLLRGLQLEKILDDAQALLTKVGVEAVSAATQLEYLKPDEAEEDGEYSDE